MDLAIITKPNLTKPNQTIQLCAKNESLYLQLLSEYLKLLHCAQTSTLLS